MLETLVVGIIGDGRGVVRRCLDCRANSPSGGTQCRGFGVGCLPGAPEASVRASAGRAPAARPAHR